MRSRKLARIALILLAPLIMAAMRTPDLQNGTSVRTRVDITFGEQVSFSASFTGSELIARAALFLRTSPERSYSAHLAQILVADPGTATITFSPQELGLLPFVQISYYWQFDLADGTVLSTQEETTTYLDHRFTWRELDAESAAIFWVEGDLDWAQELQAVAEAALDDFGAILGVADARPRRIYVYPDQTTLENSLRQAGYVRAGAHSIPELGVVLIAGDTSAESLIRLERDIPHELVHLLLYERMGSSIDNLPVWLSEGLATYYAQTPDPLFSTTLQDAVRQGSLIEMQSLCSSIPITNEQAVLAYAQSASFIGYLLDIYGNGGVLRLLDAYEAGTSCEGGVQRVYQRSLSQLESEWKRSALGLTPGLRITSSTLMLLAASVLVVLLVILWGYRRWVRKP